MTAMTTRTLVTSLVAEDGSLDAGEVYRIGETLGFTYHQVRLCLSRLVQEGLFVQSGRGRKAVFTASPTVEGWRGLEAGPSVLAMAFAQDAGDAPWDRLWRIVTFDFDEAQRSERNSFRQFLHHRGAGALTKGVYVSPHDWDREVMDVAKQVGVVERTIMSTATTLRVGDSADPATVASRVWSLDELAAEWERFVAEHRGAAKAIARHVADGSDPAKLAVASEVVRVSAAFEMIIHHDPLLPRELLPRRWPGATARSLILDIDEACAPLMATDGAIALFRRYDDVLLRARQRRSR